MAAVCALAYAVGSVIRYNIRYAEPLIEDSKASHHTTLFERVSDVALVAAYAISVCLYLKIMASFLLGGLDKIWPGIDSSLTEHLVTVAVIVTIGLIGYFKGLQLLQKLEDIALWITMLIILALFVGCALAPRQRHRDRPSAPRHLRHAGPLAARGARAASPSCASASTSAGSTSIPRAEAAVVAFRARAGVTGTVDRPCMEYSLLNRRN